MGLRYARPRLSHHPTCSKKMSCGARLGKGCSRRNRRGCAPRLDVQNKTSDIKVVVSLVRRMDHCSGDHGLGGAKRDLRSCGQAGPGHKWLIRVQSKRDGRPCAIDPFASKAPKGFLLAIDMFSGRHFRHGVDRSSSIEVF